VDLFYERWPLSEKPDPRFLTEATRRRAKIGKSHWEARLSAIPDGFDFKQIIKGYIAKMHLHERAGLGLFLYGSVGSGKTSLGSIVLRNALARGGLVLSMRAVDMVDELTSRRPVDLPNGSSLINGLRNVNYLLLDDFVAEDKVWRTNKIESVLRARYDERLPTIITTNMTKDDVFEIPWFKSFLFERFIGVKITGIDWRKNPPAI
jgi:DNA replication protein DnaC